MTVTVDSFRESFNAFNNTETFPPSEITYWITLAGKLHNADRFADVLDDAVMLFVAHNITLEFNARAAAANGQSPGSVIGAITSASVDKVSYSRDAASAMATDAGHWNLTIYGLRWLQLARIFGAGGIQLGAPTDGAGSTGAWPGPMPAVW